VAVALLYLVLVRLVFVTAVRHPVDVLVSWRILVAVCVCVCVRGMILIDKTTLALVGACILLRHGGLGSTRVYCKQHMVVC
jgi:hypothetical protein